LMETEVVRVPVARSTIADSMFDRSVAVKAINETPCISL